MKYDAEHIDQYLNGELSKAEVKAFEEKISTDKDFAYEVELQEAAIQAIQYPNFMRGIKNVRNEIATEPTIGDKAKTSVVEMKPKRSRTIRRLLTIAATLLLIILAYFILPKSPHNPMAATTDLIIKFESGDKGGDTRKTPLQEGIKLFETGDYQAAIPLFDQVIRENPNKRTDAQFLKADALHHLGRKDDARAVLQSIKKVDNEKHYKEAQMILKKYK